MAILKSSFVASQLAAPSLQSPSLHHNVPYVRPRNSQRQLAVSCSATSSTPGVTSADSSAPAGTYTPKGGLSPMNLMTMAVNSLFQFQPFFRFAAGKARAMMVERGDLIGYPWEPALKELRKHDWDAEIRAVERKDLSYPEYYLKPFHAYEKGNLCLDAALEVELAARAVHAPIFDPLRNELDPRGDERLRSSYHEKMLSLLRINPKTIVDIGCAAGLSTFALYETFPQASFIGVDLSPYFVAVANYNLRKREEEEGRKLPFQFVHAAGEATGIEGESVDLVSMCLVCHELPRSATKQIIAEAHRILRPGGAFCIMEMNPNSPLLQRMVENVFAFTAFKATEPYFDDYRTFPIEEAIESAGFEYPYQVESSPRHRTIVAHKQITY